MLTRGRTTDSDHTEAREVDRYMGARPGSTTNGESGGGGRSNRNGSIEEGGLSNGDFLGGKVGGKSVPLTHLVGQTSFLLLLPMFHKLHSSTRL